MYSSAMYYEILGVSPDASESEIREAYRRLAKKWHPDMHQNESEQEQRFAADQFRLVKEAYDAILGAMAGGSHQSEARSTGSGYTSGASYSQSSGGDSYAGNPSDDQQDASFTEISRDFFDLFVTVSKLVGAVLLALLLLSAVGAIIYAGVKLIIFLVEVIVTIITIGIPLAILGGIIYLLVTFL